MALKMKIVLIIFLTLTVFGCTSNLSSLETRQHAPYAPADSRLGEYVNRVGKRVLIVSDRPSNNYNFVVMQTNQPILEVNQETHSVIISKGVLEQLNDEAELAAALALGVSKLNNTSDIDRETATILYRAGYDPKAMLELQEQYFHNANINQSHWLASIYAVPPTAGTLTSNKIMLKKMPQGLLRGNDNYHKELKE